MQGSIVTIGRKAEFIGANYTAGMRWGSFVSMYTTFKSPNLHLLITNF